MTYSKLIQIRIKCDFMRQRGLRGPPEGQGRRSGCQAAGAALRAARRPPGRPDEDQANQDGDQASEGCLSARAADLVARLPVLLSGPPDGRQAAADPQLLIRSPGHQVAADQLTRPPGRC